MPTRCYFIKETGRVLLSLRRYSSGATTCVANNGGYHNVQLSIAETMQLSPEGAVELVPADMEAEIREKYKNAWPVMCHCGFPFSAEDVKQIFRETEYADEHGRLTTLRNALPGAIWDATWYHDWADLCGPDGKSLHVKLPNGREWNIDSRASNCDSPCQNCGRPFFQHNIKNFPCKDYVDARPHKCWIRSGAPPNLHVDKSGVTCGAGAGSILSGNYHGFLQHGFLNP